MNELSAALRHFADQIDAGNMLPGATQCALVLGDDLCANVQATYIRDGAPTSAAGIHLLAAGIQRFNVDAVVASPVSPSALEGAEAKVVADGSLCGGVVGGGMAEGPIFGDAP
jgi:ABC-type sugar transport system substrate-binding protein